MANKSSDKIEFSVANTKYKISREEYRFSTLYFKRHYEQRYKENVSAEEMKQAFFNRYENILIEGYVLEIYLKNKEHPIIFCEDVTPEKTLEECKNTLLQIEQLF